MSVLDKRLFLAELQEKLDLYIPAATVRQIIADAGEALTGYEVTTIAEDSGPHGKEESRQLIKMFIDAKAVEGRSKGTLECYEYQLNRLLEKQTTPLRKLTVYHLRQHMMAEKERGISMNTIKGNCQVYNGFYTWLHNEGMIPTNPAANIGTIKARAEEEEPFTSEEIQLLKEATQDDMQRAILHFLLSTGCRISEVCSVNRQDIDYQNLRLWVIGKGDKRRMVYIDDVTSLMLRRYLATRGDIDPALFYSRAGRRFTPGGIRRMLTKLGERANVPNVHPHRFRHTMATNLIDRGMKIQEVSTILGHAKLDTTMTYVHVNQRNTENDYRRYASL